MNQNILEKIYKLIKTGSSAKLIYGHTEEAKSKFLEAYKLLEDFKSETVLRHICAYRLGHLIMRTASNEDELLDAEEYFNEASKSKSLGPLPIIYNIAVLHRLNQPKEKIRKKVKKAIEKIVEVNNSENYENLWDYNPQLQNEYINMLELAIYFSQVEYQILEGLGALRIDENFLDLFPKSTFWKIAVSENLYHRFIGYSLPKELACEEVELIVKNAPSPAIGFIFDNRDSFKYIIKNGKNISIHKKSWGKSVKKFFIFLLNIHKYADYESPQVSEMIFNTTDTSLLRASKSKFTKYLNNIFNDIPSWKNTNIIIQDRSFEIGYKLNSELNIVVGYDETILNN